MYCNFLTFIVNDAHTQYSILLLLRKEMWVKTYMYKEIQKGSGAKSHMRKGFLIQYI